MQDARAGSSSDSPASASTPSSNRATQGWSSSPQCNLPDPLPPQHAAIREDTEALLAPLALLLHRRTAWIGETLGYLFTAAWTRAVVRALHIAPRLGLPSAVMIAMGVPTPLPVPGADAVNFAGYLLWSVWMVMAGVRSLRREDRSEPVHLVA
ncbi:hypothetical protein ABZ345_01180 [Lentzea sp. NPDC005914]|uniref:hypothetical protein n=1 Tax=Lentzea sp. NPDC005914 TaxID=3154572 RepID=UPI0033F696CA